MGRLFNCKTVLCTIWFLTITLGEAGAQSPGYRPGELIVKFKSTHQAATTRSYAGSHRMRTLGTLNRGRIQHVTLPSTMSVGQAMTQYQQDPDVDFVEPNYYLHAQTLPNDPDLDLQWGLINSGQAVSGYAGTPGADIDAAHAWDLAGSGADVVVAVIDTGVTYDHPDLSDAIWTNPSEIDGNGIDDDHNGWVDDVRGWDFVDEDNSPMDATGHGTHIAGIIAAQRDNTVGIAGISDRVRIMPLRFMDAFDRGTIADAIEAIDYAVSTGARIINCSWGTTGYSYALRETIANADALFVCAAGNEGTDSDITGFFPANFGLSNILSVAASDQMDQLAWFSNYGRQSVDVAAPGVRIYSLNHSRRMIWEDDFDDADISDWQTGGDAPVWSVVDPPYAASTPALADNPEGGYDPDINTWIVSPTLDLSQAAATTATFFLIGSSQLNYDVLYLEVSTNLSTWYCRPLQKGSTIVNNGISGAVPYWIPVTADLGPWDGEEQVTLRFRFSSNSSIEECGFYIDNISVSAADPETEQYQFMHGTSMAAGFASGVAAMVLSNDLSLTPSEIKAIIEKSVDLDYGLYDDVGSAGRINAHNALTLLSDLSLTADATQPDQVSLSWGGSAPLSATISVQRRAENQTAFQDIAQVNASENGYTDEDLPDGSVYYYRVLAQTQDGRSGYSPQALAAPEEYVGASGSSGGSSGGGGCFINSLLLH